MVDLAVDMLQHRQGALQGSHAVGCGLRVRCGHEASFRPGSQTMDSGRQHEAKLGHCPACASLDASTLGQAHKDVSRLGCVRVMKSTDLGECKSRMHAAP